MIWRPYKACIRSSFSPTHTALYRDQHRQQLLKETGKEFALDYASALVEGPTPALLAKLGPEADNYLEVVAAHPLKSTTFKVS
jgi:hypothetical protein